MKNLIINVCSGLYITNNLIFMYAIIRNDVRYDVSKFIDLLTIYIPGDKIYRNPKIQLTQEELRKLCLDNSKNLDLERLFFVKNPHSQEKTYGNFPQRLINYSTEYYDNREKIKEDIISILKDEKYFDSIIRILKIIGNTTDTDEAKVYAYAAKIFKDYDYGYLRYHLNYIYDMWNAGMVGKKLLDMDLNVYWKYIYAKGPSGKNIKDGLSDLEVHYRIPQPMLKLKNIVIQTPEQYIPGMFIENDKGLQLEKIDWESKDKNLYLVRQIWRTNSILKKIQILKKLTNKEAKIYEKNR